MKYIVLNNEVYVSNEYGWANGTCVASCTSKEAANAAARLFNESYSGQKNHRNHPAFEKGWADYGNS